MTKPTEVIMWDLQKDEAMLVLALMTLANIVISEEQDHDAVSDGFPRCCEIHSLVYDQALIMAMNVGPPRYMEACKRLQRLLEANGVTVSIRVDQDELFKEGP